MNDVSEAIAALKAPTVSDGTITGKAWKIQNLAYRRAVKEKTDMTKNFTNPPTQSELEEINALVEDIPGLFAQFLTPTPESVYSIGNHCGTGMNILERTTASSALSGVKTDLTDEFKGKAAGSFFSNYVDVHDTITGNQVEAVAAVANAINADALIYHNARATVDKIADKTLEALGSAGMAKHGGKVLLLVGGTLAAIGAAAVSGGAATAVGATIYAKAAFATSIATTTLTAATNTYYINQDLGGGNVAEVLKSMTDVLDKTKTAIEDQQNQLAKNIQTARGQLWSMWKGELPDGSGGHQKTDLNYDINGKEGSMLIAHQAAG